MQNLFIKYLDAIDYRITSGEPFLWSCWKGARYYDCDTDYGNASIIADPLKSITYQITVYSNKDCDKPYRWINPDYLEAHVAECRERHLDPDIAWSDSKWIDTECPDDILDKVKAILNNLEFDTRIVISLEIPTATFNKLAMLAHNNRMSLNDYFCYLLRDTTG
jgi:hypothetical protein